MGAVLGTLALACNGGEGTGEGPGDDPNVTAVDGEASVAGGPIATVTGINGPGGLASSELPPGTFLGKGGVLAMGQTVETPKGTLAELQLADGTTVRLNEDTALKLPTAKWPRRLELTRGEAVAVVAAGGEPVEIAAGAEMLSVVAGEVQVRNVGDARRFAMISGRASLKTPSKTLELGPGESIDAPLPTDVHEAGPELSLAPLDDTAWTRTFASAAQMTQAVPDGVGSLTARRAGSNTEQQRLRLTDQKVTVNIAGRVAHTEIEQAFFNDRGVVLEGIYRFPLPSDGSVSGLGLLVGNRWMEGEVLEKERARNIFSQIVDATIPRDPALLEWEHGNVFKLRVFPIPGNGERKVRLSYTQVLPVVAGKLRYRFPMGGSGAGGTPIEDFAFTVNIDRSELDAAQLSEIDTPMLALDQRLDGDVVSLSTSVRNFIPTSDLGVDVPLAEAAHRVHAATHLDRDGQAYFMLALRPEFDTGRVEGPTNIAFVVDRSHSTTPELWTLATGIVQAMATTMDANDRFTVLACDTACNRMPGGLASADTGAIADAGLFLGDQDLAGASDVGAMLKAGAEALSSATSGERVVVYLGDGAPTSGAMTPDELGNIARASLQGTRILAVALGARSDVTTLDAILDATGGDIVRADPRDDIPALVRDLSLRARVPMVRDLELDLPDGMLMVRKQGVTGLRKDDTLLVAGKLSHPVSGEIRLRGHAPSGPVETTFTIDLSAERREGDPASVHQHLPRTWAQMQIAHLTKTKGFAAHDEIVKLSQDYTVLSRFTAMLVLENDAMFREFNVVRREADKDRWTGNLPEPEETVTGSALPRTADASSTAGSTKSLEPLGEGGEDSFRKTDKAKDNDADGLRLSGPATDPPPPPGATPPAEPEPADSIDLDERRKGGTKSGSSQQAFPDLPDFDGNRDRERKDSKPDTGFDFGGDVSEDEDDDNPFGAPKNDPSPTKKKKSAAAKPNKMPTSSSRPIGEVGDGGWGAPSGGVATPASKHGRGWHARRIPTLRVRTVSAPSSRSLAQVDDLARRVALDPTRRAEHGRLVRTAIRAGHADATEFARAWAEVDPDHAPALLSLADMLAAAGDPTAARAYASAIEVRPFDSKQHENLARGLAGKGDLARACSHRHAIVSIDPTKVEHHAELVRCLVTAGRIEDARLALGDARARATGISRSLDATFAALAAEVSGAALPPEVKLFGSAQLTASLTWSGEEELDIVVVDSRGQRLSALRSDGKLRAREGRGSEELTMKKVSKSVFIEVTRHGDGTDADLTAPPASGTLSIKTSGGSRKTIPFTMRGGTIRLAKVFWST